MKHSKLFLTGMAALLLSFGLMMTGCDSGGDSDSGGDPINTAEYISIEETTAGAPTVPAVYTVTVKQSLAGKVVTFTNVATDPVVYGPPANAEDTLAKQATAIVAKINAAAGAIYDVAYTASAESFTLTAKTAGAIANAPAVAIDNYTPPPVKTSEAFTVTAGDNALKITGTAGATGTFDESAKVYIKDGGKEVLITDETPAPTGYTAPSGTVVLIADTGTGGVPVLWVKGLDAAVSGSAADGKILAGADVKVVITGAAQTGDVGTVAAPVSGTAVVLPAGVKTLIAFGAAIANQVSVKGGDGNQIHYHNGTGDVTATLSTTFDTQLSAVLASGLVADDEITVDAKGIITSAELIAGPDAAVIGTALGVLDNVTIGAATTLIATDEVAIAAGKVLTLAASKNLVLTSAAAAPGAKITGLGKLVAGFTEIIPGVTGVIGSSGSGVKTTTIAHDGSGKTTVTGTDTNAILAVSSGAVITQKTGADSELALVADTNVNILDGAELKLETGAILSGATATGIVNVGSTDTTKFAIKGVSTGTLTAGGSTGDTVSLMGLQAGSKIKGSAATATLTGGGADMDIAVAAAAVTGAVIDTVTLDLSVNGKISIAQNGVLKLAPNGGITTAGASQTPIHDADHATGTSTTIRGTGSGCTIDATTGAVAIDDGDTFTSSGGAVTVTTN